jgi:hypothetical protein
VHLELLVEGLAGDLPDQPAMEHGAFAGVLTHLVVEVDDVTGLSGAAGRIAEVQMTGLEHGHTP